MTGVGGDNRKLVYEQFLIFQGYKGVNHLAETDEVCL